jgi:hypothetical protein
MSVTRRARCIQLGGVVSVIVAIFYFFILLNLSSSFSFQNIQQKKTPEGAAINTIPASKDHSPQQRQQQELQQQWWDRYVQDIARPFPPWKGEKYSWCLLEPGGNNKDDEEDDNLGLVFVKNPKAASSTGAGINKRIARHAAAAMKKLAAAAQNTTTTDTTNATNSRCKQFSKHGAWYRKKKHTLLWTNVRDPAKKSVSRFFHFEVSRRGENPTTQNMLPYLQAQKGFQVNYIRTGKQYKKNESNKTTLQFVQIIKKEIFKAFDFIALVERMDESLVVMKLLFDLEDKDMIVLSAKSSGGYDDGMFESQCFLIQKAFTTPEVDEYLATDFKVDNADYLLYAAANRSLDLTIDALGRKRVEHDVRKHRVLQKLAEEKCLAQAVFPCSANGTRQTELSALDCYEGDADGGCGYRCVDRIIQKYYESSSSK